MGADGSAFHSVTPMGMRAPAAPKYWVSQPRTVVTWSP